MISRCQLTTEKRPTGKKRDRYRQRYPGSDTTGSYIALSINGTLVGDNIYATSNPGIGIQYKTSVDTLTDAGGGTESTLNSRFNLGQQVAADISTYVHVKYRLVRLTNKIPAGKITSAPQVTATFTTQMEGVPLYSLTVFIAQRLPRNLKQLPAR